MTTMTLDAAFLLNPTVSLPRNTLAPFVDMGALQPFTRDVRAVSLKPYAGGAKFLDGDVLMARITPSLENGKTAIYRAAQGEPGPAFGSTEFIVIRGRKGLSDSRFAYYLVTSPEVRERAIATMNGSSGRQRVQHDAFASFLIDLPSVEEQCAIADTLGALDDKIESNRRAQAIGEELIRSLVTAALEGSTGGIGVLGDYCRLIKDPARNSALTEDLHYIGFEHMPRGSIFLDSWGTAAGLGSDKSYFQSGDVLFGKLRPYFKKVGIAPVNGVCSTDILVLRPKLEGDAAIVAVVASSDTLIDSLSAAATGTRMPRASWKDLSNWPVVILTAVERSALAEQVAPLLKKLTLLTHESNRLRLTRDTLLPELVSGRIRVPEAAEALG